MTGLAEQVYDSYAYLLLDQFAQFHPVPLPTR